MLAQYSQWIKKNTVDMSKGFYAYACVGNQSTLSGMKTLVVSYLGVYQIILYRLYAWFR